MRPHRGLQWVFFAFLCIVCGGMAAFFITMSVLDFRLKPRRSLMGIMITLMLFLVLEVYRQSIVRRRATRAGDPVFILRGRAAWGDNGLLIGGAGVHFIDLNVRAHIRAGDECVVEVLPILPFTVLGVLEVNGRALTHPDGSH